METTYQEIIYQVLALVTAGVVGLVGTYLNKYVKAKAEKVGYEFKNSRVERILANAIHYGEEWGAEYAKKRAGKVKGSEKYAVAIEYINSVDSSIITEYGGTLQLMVNRKLNQIRDGK